MQFNGEKKNQSEKRDTVRPEVEVNQLSKLQTVVSVCYHWIRVMSFDLYFIFF